MKLLFENWRKFVNEEASPEEIEDVVVDVLKDEGGAAGKEPIEDALEDLDLPEGFDLEEFLEGLEDVGQHEDGDYILGDDQQIQINKLDLEEGIQIFLEMKEDMLDEKRRKKRKKKKKKGKKDASGALVKCRKVGAANWGTGGKKKKRKKK